MYQLGRRVWRILYGATVEVIADNGLVLAASIAFFAIFSLAPLLLLVVAFAGPTFGQAQTRAEIQNQFEALMGPDSAQFIASVLSRASEAAHGVAAVVGIGTLMFGSRVSSKQKRRTSKRIVCLRRAARANGQTGRSPKISCGCSMNPSDHLTTASITSASRPASDLVSREQATCHGLGDTRRSRSSL